MIRVTGVAFHLGPIALSIHFVIESIAYSVGFFLYRRQRRRQGDVIAGPDRSSILVAAILGAAVGSRLLSLAEEPILTLQDPLTAVFGGKTVVGALLGGTLAVEWVKRRLHIRVRTGDLFAIPLAVAIAIGRLGCFFGGLADRTYGVATNLPWAVDFGDGVGRHPVQLYEILFLAALTGVLAVIERKPHKNGELFRVFFLAYLAWRFAIDFLKPEPALGGLAAIQWACGVALIWYLPGTVRMFSHARSSEVYG